MKRTRNKKHWLRVWVPILAAVLVLCLLALVVLVMTRQTPEPEAPANTGTTAAAATVRIPETTDAVQTTAAADTTETTETTEATEATVPEEETTNPTEPKPTVPATQPTEPKPTVPATQPAEPKPTEPPEPENPADLTAMLEAGGVSYDLLQQKNSSQLVTVVAGGSKAQIRFFALQDGVWEENKDLKTSGYVGRNGVSASKEEGDGCTPAGLYGIGTGFYISKTPDTALELFQITADTYWVDDPDSVYYNQRVEGTEHKDWDSAEKMSSYKTAYKYGFVVNYNTDCTPGAGSAIFFHVGSKATAGCIAVSEKLVLKYLSGLDAGKNPYILIISEKDLAS